MEHLSPTFINYAFAFFLSAAIWVILQMVYVRKDTTTVNKEDMPSKAIKTSETNIAVKTLSIIAVLALIVYALTKRKGK